MARTIEVPDKDTILCYQHSIELLRKNSLPEGFIASSATNHYAAIWARDACITAIGANLTGDNTLLRTSESTINTLARLQAPRGQIPAVYWPGKSYWDWGEMGATDAAAWFIIAAWHCYKTTGNKDFIRKVSSSVFKAFNWLCSQDANNFGLIDSPEASDWMDSTLNRCGKVMYINALFYLASLAIRELADFYDNSGQDIAPDVVSYKFNHLFWPEPGKNYGDILNHVDIHGLKHETFPHPCSAAAFQVAAEGRRYYLSHVSYGRFTDMCEVLGNSLAIISGLATVDKQLKIIDYFIEKKVAEPYPASSLADPVTGLNNKWGVLKPDVEQLQAEPWRNPPGCYHNAGIWPYIGGFYTLALEKSGRKELATAELIRLSQANKLGKDKNWEFHEWINSNTGEATGAAQQSWNAATYIMAYRVLENTGISRAHGLPVLIST